MTSDLCDYNNEKKKNCARWHLVLSPPLFIPHPPFAYSPFFLPRRQLLPEWRNPAVTWLPENTSCIFSRDFRIASPFPGSPSFAAGAMLLYLSLTNSPLPFSRFWWAPESGLRAHGFWSSLTLDLDTVCEQSLILHRCRFRAGIVDRVCILHTPTTKNTEIVTIIPNM